MLILINSMKYILPYTLVTLCSDGLVLFGFGVLAFFYTQHAPRTLMTLNLC